jgi:hypothetical protein
MCNIVTYTNPGGVRCGSLAYFGFLPIFRKRLYPTPGWRIAECRYAPSTGAVYRSATNYRRSIMLTHVGNYGTRNVVEVMESWFWERPTDCLVLSLAKF